MTASSSQDVTHLLLQWSNGNADALDRLIPLVYDELRKLARHYMRRERTGHTLQTTALVNEVYLRLTDQRRMSWRNRAQFFGVCAQLMRRILVDYARSRRYGKRQGETRKISLDETAVVAKDRGAELIAVDDALISLAAFDLRKSRIVEMRFFGGLSTEEAAEAIGVSPRTVDREWRKAKAWLHRAIRDDEANDA